MHRFLAVALVAVSLAGCANVSDSDPVEPSGLPVISPQETDLIALADLTMPGLNITLVESVVDAAVDMTGDLYEPTMEVCDDGSIYITGHTIAVDTTGAPVFGSHDGGETWQQLPFTRDLYMPEPVHGATPPVSDEIFLSCGDDGWLYGVDITLFSFPVNAWSDYGTFHAYFNPNAYDEAAVVTSNVGDTSGQCAPAPAKDRPWGAYAGGKLLMVNNPASGPAQIGVLDMPPATPVAVGATVGGASWNLCAGLGQVPVFVSIPGVPALRDDGFFVVPQRNSNLHGELHLITGNVADIMNVQAQKLFDYTTGGEITSVYGMAQFDADGVLYVGITANSEPEEDERRGGLKLAVSQDDGLTFQTLDFHTERGKHLVHFWMDGNDWGPGALVVWATPGDVEGYDWYMGHLTYDALGRPVLENVSLVIDDGIAPSAHVTGAALGPDGRAYTAMYTTRAGTPQAPTTPLSVYMQTDGAVLPTPLAPTA